MKRRIVLWTLLAVLSLGMAAQEKVNFLAGTPAHEGISRKNANALKLKLEQILARNNAGTVSDSTVYVVQPELILGETKRTEGLLRDVTLVTGELSLTARNNRNGSVYATVVLELQGDTNEGKEQAVASLISQIKVTDRAFVRFIRTARKRIAEACAKECVATEEKAAVSAEGTTTPVPESQEGGGE